MFFFNCKTFNFMFTCSQCELLVKPTCKAIICCIENPDVRFVIIFSIKPNVYSYKRVGFFHQLLC